MTTSWSKTSIAGSLPTLRTTWIAESTSGRTASSSGKYHQVREPSRQPFIAATREPPEQSGATQDGPLIPSVLRKARAVTSRTIPEAKEARQMPGLFHVKGKPANAASTNRIPPGCGWIRNITSDRLLCKSLTEQCVLDNPTSLHHRQAGRPRGRIVLCPHETTASDGQNQRSIQTPEGLAGPHAGGNSPPAETRQWTKTGMRADLNRAGPPHFLGKPFRSDDELRTLPENHGAERTINNEVNINKKVRHRRDTAGEPCPAASAMRTEQREAT